MLPTILPASQIRPFNFYAQNGLYQGMMLNGQLYKHVASFEASARLKAFEQGCALSRQGNTVITADGAGRYDLWTDVRIQIKTAPLVQLDLEPSAAAAPTPTAAPVPVPAASAS